MIREEWRDIPDFPGYQVSNTGKVRSFWKKIKKKGCWGGYYRELTEEWYELSQSDDGNGYMKVCLQNDEKRRCVKVHRLVAEAFISHHPDEDTVDHIRSGPEGKLDNTVNNLRWISRRDNIQKAYLDGVCDERIEKQNKPIILTDLWTGKEIFCRSINEAAEITRRDRSMISHALTQENNKVSHYIVEGVDPSELLLYGDYYDYGFVENDLY